MSISVELHKKMAGFSLDVAFEAGDGVLGLLGASGSGKSMTLRAIAGIVRPDSGRVVVGGRVLFDSAVGVNLPPRARNLGLLFQNYALFPTMTVAQNIAAGVRDRAKRRSQVERYLRLLRLEGLGDRYPRQLSGGQQQRVALARIMASQPDLLMLDEPFSALDEQLRWELEPEFTAALGAFSGTVLYVSHSIGEVYRYCGDTAVVSCGKIVEQGGTKALFERPSRLETARLLCCRNIGRAGGGMTGWGFPAEFDGCAGFYSDEVQLSATGGEGWLPARVAEVSQRPRYTVLRLQMGEGKQIFSAHCERELAGRLERQGRAWFRIPPGRLLHLSSPEV